VTMGSIKILLISALCASVSVVSSKSFAIKPRIVGGNDAEPNQFPYSVGLFLDGDFPMIACGGAIIGERHILSSGVCASNLKEKIHEIIAILGTPDNNLDAESTFSTGIDTIYVHQRFRESSMKNDLSLCRTAKKIIFSEAIQPIALPKVDLESDEGVPAVVTGWGFLKEPEHLFDFDLPEKLQYQNTKTMQYGSCVAAYANGLKDDDRLKDIQRRFRNTNIICTNSAKGQGICLGDFGSPLVSNGTLIGIASWTTGCDSGLPDVYTKIYPHMKWIQDEMEEILESDGDSDNEENLPSQCAPQ